MARSTLAPALATMLLALGAAAPAHAKDVAIGFDAITTPGEAVEIGAKFEGGGWTFWRPDRRNRVASFTVDGRTYTTRTDSAGKGRVRVTPSRVGVYPIEARLDGKAASDARGRLFVLDPLRPNVVVDLDQTVCDMPQWKVPFQGGKAPAYPGAVNVLRDLARTHGVIYLTARDEHLNGVTRAFLARHGFPDGPVLFNDMGFDTAAEREELSSKNHGKYKLEVMQGLRGRGVDLVLGIGNTSTDAFAYEGMGLDSYIFDTPSVPAPVPPPSVRFSAYEPGLRALLVRDGHLPGATPTVGMAALVGSAP